MTSSNDEVNYVLVENVAQQRDAEGRARGDSDGRSVNEPYSPPSETVSERLFDLAIRLVKASVVTVMFCLIPVGVSWFAQWQTRDWHWPKSMPTTSPDPSETIAHMSDGLINLVVHAWPYVLAAALVATACKWIIGVRRSARASEAGDFPEFSDRSDDDPWDADAPLASRVLARHDAVLDE